MVAAQGKLNRGPALALATAIAGLAGLCLWPGATAIASTWMLSALGLPVWRVDGLMGHGAFVAEVHWTCTAAMLAAPLLAARALLWRRHLLRDDSRWCAAALAGAWAFNEIRLAGLVWVGVSAPAQFDWMHGQAAPLAMAMLGAGFLLLTQPRQPGTGLGRMRLN